MIPCKRKTPKRDTVPESADIYLIPDACILAFGVFCPVLSCFCILQGGEPIEPAQRTYFGEESTSDRELYQPLGAGPTQTDVWATKPPWCQPWTILGTGFGVVGIVWLLSNGSVFWTGLVGVPICLWWYLFLGVMPASYQAYVEQEIAARKQFQDQQRFEDQFRWAI